MPKLRNGLITPQIGWHWYDHRFIYQDCEGGCRIVLSDGALVAPTGTTLLRANGNRVYAYIEFTGPIDPLLAVYRDSFGRNRTNCYPAAISPDGFIAVHPHSSIGLTVLHPDKSTETLITPGEATGVQMVGGTNATWREGWDLESNFPVQTPLVKFYDYAVTAQGDVLAQATTGELILNNRIVQPPSDAYYYLGIERIGDVITYTWSPSQADINGEIRSIAVADLVNLPLIVAPAPPASVKPLPRKMWMAPFFSHSERYGDTPLSDHVGNAITVVSGDGSAASLASELRRIVQLGQPMVTQGDLGVNHAYVDSTVAWWTSGGDVVSLGSSVIRASLLPEKPIIAYLDGRGWPDIKPSWVSSRVWPSIQMYRKPGERAVDFMNEMDALINKVSRYGQPMVITPRFDDFNGSSTVEAQLEVMPFYEVLINKYQVVGMMPFSDRRGNGIAKNPTLHAWAKAYLDAVPARPNRFDYWTSSGDMAVAIRNKLMQTTDMIVLLPAEKKFILDKIK